MEVTYPFSLPRLPNARARVDTSAEEAVLKTALADTIDGVEEEDIGDSTCTDARRRLSIGNATDADPSSRRRPVAFDLSLIHI